MALTKKWIKNSMLSGLIGIVVYQGVVQAAPKVGIAHLAYSNDSRQILYISNRLPAQRSQSATPVIHFINAQNGQAANNTELVLNPQQQLVMGFTPDGFKLAVLEAKGLSILHNKTGKTLRTLPVPALPRLITRYRPSLAITNASGTQQLFHAESQNKLNMIHTGNGKNLASISLPKQQLLSMGISPNGRIVAFLMAVSGSQHQLHLFDSYQKKVVDTVDLPAQRLKPFYQAIVFSPDGKHLFAGSLLVNIDTKKITPFPATTRSTPAIFTPNNRYLLIPHGANQMLRYDLIKQQKQVIHLKLPAHCDTSDAYDTSPNRAWLAIGSHCLNGREKADFISVLNANSGEFVRNLRPVIAIEQ